MGRMGPRTSMSSSFHLISICLILISIVRCMEAQSQLNLTDLPSELIIDIMKSFSFVCIHKLLTVSKQFGELCKIVLNMKYDLEKAPRFVDVGAEFFDKKDGQPQIIDYFIEQGFLKCLVDYVFVGSDSDDLFNSKEYDKILKTYLNDTELDGTNETMNLICPSEKFMTLFKIALLKRKLEEPLKLRVEHLSSAIDELAERKCLIKLPDYRLFSYITESPNLNLQNIIDQVSRNEDKKLHPKLIKLIKDGEISEDLLLDYETPGKLTLALALRIGKHGDESIVKKLIDKMHQDQLTARCFESACRFNQDEKFIIEILFYARHCLNEYHLCNLEAYLLLNQQLPKDYFVAFKGFQMADFSNDQIHQTIIKYADSVEASSFIFDCAAWLGKEDELLIEVIHKTSYEFDPLNISSAPFVKGISDSVLQAMIPRITRRRHLNLCYMNSVEESIIAKNFAAFQPATLHDWLICCPKDTGSISSILTQWSVYFHSNEQLVKVLDLFDCEHLEELAENASSFELCVNNFKHPDDKLYRLLVIRIYADLRLKRPIQSDCANWELLKGLFNGIFDQEILQDYLDTVTEGDCLELFKFWLRG